jgi:ribonuclease VapC
MFFDASAIVSMVTGEHDADDLADLMNAARVRMTSPIAIFEAVLAVRRKRRSTVADVTGAVHEFLSIVDVRMVPTTTDEAELALEAFSRYGRGQDHPAQLNMGDCFAYAAAKYHDTLLLYKGDDFVKTDIPLA